MSSISDFFTQSSSSSATAALPRVTHGTTCQKYTVGCCSACCTCIPAGVSAWAYEMIGQGAGGAGACCCMYAPWGGRGGHYAAARQSVGSGSQGMCYCACSCWCCSPAATGHCGQISRICSCGSLSTVGTNWCAMSGGGCCYGCTCCNYACSYICPCRMDQAVSTHIETGLPCGGATATASSLEQGLHSMMNQSTNSNADGGVNESTYFESNFIGTLSLAAGGSAPVSIGGTNLCDSSTSIFSKQGEGCFCHPGNSKAHDFKCNVTECFSFDGSEGWSTGSMDCFQSICGHVGVGGAAYAGGGNQTCIALGSTNYWIGCMGHFPGGGGHSSGMCPGGCCCGSIGGAGVIAISYDN